MRIKLLVVTTAVPLTIMGLAGVAGFFLERNGTLALENLDRQEFTAMVRARASEPDRLGQLGKIVATNLTGYAALLFGGIVSLGLAPVLYLSYVGISWGTMVSNAISSGISTEAVTLFLLPHGIPELLAFALVSSLGFRSLYYFVRYIHHGTLLKEGEAASALIVALTSLILLLLAGVVEVTVTPQLGSAVLADSGGV